MATGGVKGPDSEADGLCSSSSSSSGSSEDLRRGPNQSYESGNDTLTPNKIARMKDSMKDLKGCHISQWNDQRAHVVYGAFNVKRFKVDEEHIFYPLGGRTVKEILLLTDRTEYVEPKMLEKAEDYNTFIPASWSRFVPKMNRILEVFGDDSDLFLEGLTKVEAFHAAETSLKKKMKYLVRNPPPNDVQLRTTEQAFHFLIKKLCNEIQSHHSSQHNLPENFFEAYFERLVHIFHELSGVDVVSTKRIVHTKYQLAMPSFGTVPNPDFYLSDSYCNVLAVVELKNANKRRFKAHKGHRTKSMKDRQKSKWTSEGYTNDKELAKALMTLDMKKEMEELEDSKEADAGEDDENLDDTFDQHECQVEETLKDSLPDHIKHLDLIEKRQTRCFLPQLFGEMLACTFIKDECVDDLQKPYLTQVMGIGVVGLQVQFVMLVLQDVEKQIYNPTAADMERTRSVRPYLYVTRRLNLFRRSHLKIFFRTLFALGSLESINN